MPIPLPNLDDRSYAELTAEARALIPSVYPQWTNHNVSDPGITLVELLAWLTELLLYQVNEVPAANTERFLKLLNDPDWVRPHSMSLDEAVRQTMRALRQRYRAVTSDDYERLALHTWPQSDAAAELGDEGKLRRVKSVSRRDLSSADPAVRRASTPAHMSLVVMPEPLPGTQDEEPQPSERLRTALWTFFDARRILATRHHVVGPQYVPVDVAANLALHEDAPPGGALEAARQALRAFYDPLAGGPDHNGWPFGRAVYASEVYAVLEQVSFVDYVEQVQLATPAGEDRLRSGADGNPVGIALDADELVRIQPSGLRAYDVQGKRYQ